MERQKYKEEIQKRTIAPSSDSWNKLNNRLTTHEYKGKSKIWPLLKYTAVVLVVTSIGFYFFQPKEKVINSPIIVAPSVKEDLKKDPEINTSPETEVAVSPAITPQKEIFKKEKITKSEKVRTDNKAIAFQQSKEKSKVTETIIDVVENSEEITDNRLISQKEIEVQTVEDEVEKLLRNSQMNIAFDREKVRKRTVNANALLLEVEDDLDKDLKQKLFEKVIGTLKNQKEVVTFRENK